MRTIHREEARKILLDDQIAGGRGDDRVCRAVDSVTTSCFVVTLEDQESLFSLIWHDVQASQILTKDQSLLVGDVARRMIDRGWTFEKLATGGVVGDYDPGYFLGCVQIDEAFSFERFLWPTFVLPNKGEQRRCPTGTLYLMDGTHRTLVLAKRVLLGETIYQPIEGLLLVPRPGADR
jgi:hypothetical protein